jgi:hypothetical protein
VEALLIARFNSRRVRLISRWLRMAFVRRDICDHPFYEFLRFEDHLFNAGYRWDIPLQ